MVSNDCQQDPGRPLRFGSALFPVPHRRARETKPRGELRLAEAEGLTKGSNVDYRCAVNFHHGHADRDVLSVGPCDGLLYTSDEPSAGGGGFCLFGDWHSQD